MSDNDTVPRTRRDALLIMGVGLLGALARPLDASRSITQHPEPRPGVTAAAVLDPALVPEGARAGYEAAQAIPEVLDGLYCYCDCTERDGLRSLLSCFETRMPVQCSICVGEARMAHRLARQGRTLTEIRKSIDDRYK